MSKSNYELMEDVKIMVEMFIDDYNKKYNRKVHVPIIEFNLKGRAAGTQSCYPRDPNSSVLNFNLGMLKENYDHFIFNTIGHEVAHHICFVLYGVQYTENGRRVVHGQMWKQIMRQLGLDPKRCHNYQLPESQKRNKTTFTYKCNCKKWELTKIRHNKILRGKAQYGCPKCHTSLKQVK